MLLFRNALYPAPFICSLLLCSAGLWCLASCGDGTSPEPSTPVQVEILSGDSQSGPTGEELPEAVRVRVRDRTGNPLPGAVVSFRVTVGGGSVSAGSVPADEEGVASVRWTLGFVPVANHLEARAGEARTTLRAWASPGEPPPQDLLFEVPAGFSSEGITFWPGRGMFLGTEGGVLVSGDPQAHPEPLPLSGEGISQPVGLAFGLSGDLYVCDNGPPHGSVKRVTPAGVYDTLSPGFQGEPFALPNSLAVGPDGLVYLAATCDDRLYRIRPDDGETEVFVSIPGPNGIAFDADASYMYITTENPAIFCNGQWVQGGLFRVAVRPDGSPGEVEPLVEDFAVAGDGLAFDAEGNLYVVFSGITAGGLGDLLKSAIYVYTPDGRFNPWVSVNLPGDIFTTVAFGVPPFDPMSLYAYGFTGRLYRIFTGIPGRPLP